MKTEIQCLDDEFVALKTALEDAIIEGQRAMGDPAEIPGYTLVPDDHSVPKRFVANPGVVGWIEDF